MRCLVYHEVRWYFFSVSATTVKKVLLAILFVSALLRVGWISRGDTVNDEVFYGFRAVGLLDFDEAGKQTTPLEWFDPAPPLWTSLSFHDHPPLVFWVQHLSIKVFGENNFAMRLPSALLGVASVYLIFLLGSLLFTASAGLISASLLSVTLNHIYISRVGMQESFVIFFLLLASYLFLRAVREGRSFIPLGITLGLALLTKYNAFILFPIFGTFLLLYHREAFRRKDLWLALSLAVVIFSPVIIYNVMLYKTVGHFDFQFSYVFGQNPKEWQVAPGKEVGSLLERAQDFFPRLVGSHSWLFLALAGVALFFLRSPFLLISLGYLLLLLAVIGPGFRFLAMLTPFLALSVGAFLQTHLQLRKYFLWLLVPVLLFEVFYSINNQIAYYPVGQKPWLSSKIRYENYNWGYNELGDYFDRELARKIPSATFRMQYAFIEREQDTSIRKGERKGYLPYPALIVTYGNFDHGAKLWRLDRLKIYHGWPIIDFATYQQYLRENGADYYERSGFRDFYFVEGNIVPDPAFTELTKGLPPHYVYNPRSEAVFTIYERHLRPI